MKYLFWISFIGIFYCFIGYPFSLYIINKILKKKVIKKSSKYKPKISFIIAAHNEEKSIRKKLLNTISLNYPTEKIQIIISSDNSIDRTNKIVEKFIKENENYNIFLYKVKERKGKTNAQNEAIKLAKGEIIFFSDANSIWDKESINKIIQNFSDEHIEYVCGRLEYVNSFDNITSNTENTYWNFDLWMRKIESDYNSITAGNGAIYAIRKENIKLIPDIECHDGLYPVLSVLNEKRAIYEKEAIAFEKAGENTKDEFSRKIRMNRGLLETKYSNLSKYNPFKVGLFSYFYFCHRYLRYSLYFFHILLFISSGILLKNKIYMIAFIVQIIFYIFAFLEFLFRTRIKLFYFPYYYSITILAQLIAIIKGFLGLNKPFWEKAESTR